MIKTLTSALALAASLTLAGSALAQPSGGPDAKGNAPLKHAHTVNDGAAKHGSNSFTEKQAQEHIEKSGFTSVSGLLKGDDGVWRGQAMRNGGSVDVAMDFKGNVSTPLAGGASARSAPMTRTTSTTVRSADAPTPMMASGAATTTATHHRSRRHHHRHHRMGACANARAEGAACSGVDRNRNGVSDKEDRAMGAGAKP